MAGVSHKEIAQNMMSVHGVLAAAVVSERIEESRLHGDAAALDRWQGVEMAIQELRRTEPSKLRH